MSIHITLNAPTTISSEEKNGQTTYLEYDRVYSLSLLDTSTVSPCTHHSQYFTTVQLLCQRVECCAESEYDDEHNRDLRGTSKCSGLPIFRRVAHNKADSGDSSGQVKDAASSSLSVAWTSNGATGGRYCLLTVSLSKSRSSESDCSRSQLMIRATTQKTTSSDPVTLTDSKFEQCFAQVQMVQPGAAMERTLGDFESFHQSVEKQEKLLKVLTDEIGHLHGQLSPASIRQRQPDLHDEFVFDPVQESRDHGNKGTDKYQAIGAVEANIAHMQETLSSVHPVTMFRHHSISEASRRLPRRATDHFQDSKSTTSGVESGTSSSLQKSPTQSISDGFTKVCQSSSGKFPFQEQIISQQNATLRTSRGGPSSPSTPSRAIEKSR